MTGGPKSLLVISGTPSEDDLSLAWDNILQEYSELIQTEKTTNIFDLYKKLSYTRFKLNYLGWTLPYLKLEYSKEFAERIASLGYDFIEWKEDREAYLKQIYLVETDAKFLVVLLNQLSAEYKLLNPEGSSEEVDRAAMDYQKEINILSRFMGGRIVKEQITVFEFASYVNSYLEYNKANKK